MIGSPVKFKNWPVERQGRQLVSVKTDPSSIGEPFSQTSKAVSNLSMHAKSGLRVVLKWKIFRPDSVIATVIPFTKQLLQYHERRKVVSG